MKMRELERRTGVSRQMVQFYLAHGLLPEPVRPKPNVADYGDEHVRAIEAIRRLQTEGRLTIHEIKQALDGGSAALPRDAAVLSHLDTLFALRAGVDNQLVPLASLLAHNPQAKKDAEFLRRIGAIDLVRRDGEPCLSRMDAQIVGYWGEMRSAGFTEALGFTAETVSLYVDAALKMANAEIGIFAAKVPRTYPLEKKAAMAEAASRLMLAVFTVLRMKAEVAAFGRIEGGSHPARAPAAALRRRPRRRASRAR